jgi:hypothetical protein
MVCFAISRRCRSALARALSFTAVKAVKHICLSIATALALCLAAAQVHADYETATFSNVNPGEVVTIYAPGLQATGWAGDYNFVNGSGLINGSFLGFCIDINQDIYSNQTVTFGVAALNNAPVPGQAMGTYRANLIRELWANDYLASQQSNSNAAAFQISIWEIINEATGNPLDVTSGTFRVTDSNAATLQTANLWLSQLDLTGNGAGNQNLVALTNDTYQDYVVNGPVTAPAPSGLVLAGGGTFMLLLVAAYCRRATVRLAASPTVH